MGEEEGACAAIGGDDVKNKNMNKKNKSKRLTMLKDILQRRRQQQASSNDNDNDHDGEYKPMGGQGGVHTRNMQYGAGVLDDNETADRIRNQCSLFYDGADEEQQYNTASTQINAMRTSDVLRQIAHSSGSSIYDAENP